MKKFFLLILAFCLLSFNVLADEIKLQLLNNVSEKISESIGLIVPGEGITEFNLEFNEHEEPSFSLLAVRDLDKQDNSNLFTQFSLHNDDVSGDERYIANLGFGKRFLSSDKSMMFGVNSFLDFDLREEHARGSIGFEANASILELNYNQYLALTGKKTISGTDEQALGGSEYNLSSQIPYMPWAKINWQGYKHYADMAGASTKGDIYSMELALNPHLQLDISRDISNHEDGNKYAALLTFVYPPRENKPTFVDGLTSNDMFVKENMEDKLSGKVRRNNNIAVEIQGAVIVTSQ